MAMMTYMRTMDRAVATIESRRNRRPSGTLISSVERLRPCGSTRRPVAAEAMYPEVPKCPMAMFSPPVTLRVKGCARAGRLTMSMPSNKDPSPMTIGVGIEAEAMTIVMRVAMNSMWCPVRNTYRNGVTRASTSETRNPASMIQATCDPYCCWAMPAIASFVGTTP